MRCITPSQLQRSTSMLHQLKQAITEIEHAIQLNHHYTSHTNSIIMHYLMAIDETVLTNHANMFSQIINHRYLLTSYEFAWNHVPAKSKFPSSKCRVSERCRLGAGSSEDPAAPSCQCADIHKIARTRMKQVMNLEIFQSIMQCC